MLFNISIHNFQFPVFLWHSYNHFEFLSRIFCIVFASACDDLMDVSCPSAGLQSDNSPFHPARAAIRVIQCAVHALSGK